MDNIVLIGMPGSGKSTIAREISKKLGYTYLDADRAIEEKMHLKLSEIIEQYGDDGFRQIENDVNAELDVDHTAIAPGGSVVYGEGAMKHLKEIGTVVYLQLSYPLLKERLGDLHARGITFRPGQTLLDLYNERIPLYEKYADIVLDCDGLSVSETVAALQKKLK